MKLPTPSVPDLARLKGEDRDAVAASLKDFYESESAPFNYLTGTRAAKVSYKGYRNLAQLKAGCALERTAQGRKSNEEVIECAAPLAFGRDTRVFDLPHRQFSFGREFRSAYRVPFFFVEKGVVKLYYLQPRKGSGLGFNQLCMIATIHKKFLLETEFFGQPCDVEFVDVSAPPGTTERCVRQYAFDQLSLWSDARLTDRLTLISEALDFLQREGSVSPRKRRPSKVADDMPLF